MDPPSAILGCDCDFRKLVLSGLASKSSMSITSLRSSTAGCTGCCCWSPPMRLNKPNKLL